MTIVSSVWNAVALWLLTGAAQPAAAGADAVLAHARCEAALRSQLVEWHARLDAALVDAPGPTASRSLRVPTDALGLWVRISERGPGEVALERITAVRTERVSYDAGCVPEPSAVAMPAPPPDAVSDADLITRVARGGRGVVLLWSPHMPLSVDQHAVLARVARDLGLAVVPLLDPSADAGYAERVARERGLPPEATRPLGGIELAFRGMTTHTPSLQVFADGALRGPVLFGYRSDAALRDALAGALAAGRPH